MCIRDRCLPTIYAKCRHEVDPTLYTQHIEQLMGDYCDYLNRQRISVDGEPIKDFFLSRMYIDCKSDGSSHTKPGRVDIDATEGRSTKQRKHDLNASTSFFNPPGQKRNC